jgi:hypothetical protein
LNRWGEVADEVSRVNVEAWNARFAIGVLSLREDIEELLRKLPAAVADGITEQQLWNWPVLEEARRDGRFTAAVAEAMRRHVGADAGSVIIEGGIQESDVPPAQP